MLTQQKTRVYNINYMSILNTIKKGVRRFGRYLQEQNRIDNESREYSSKKLQKENEDEASGLYTPDPSIKTTSKKTSSGEIINPTSKDVDAYNKKYTTVKKGRGTSTGYMPR